MRTIFRSEYVMAHLRDYQTRIVDSMRTSFSDDACRSICAQLPTGGGKTAIVSAIVSGAVQYGRSVWFVVPRNELLDQASEHFRKWGIAHGRIAAGREESAAFRVHVVSKDTLTRRMDRIRSWPDILIFDECHLYLDCQVQVEDRARQAKPDLRVIGMTATPERLDGKGLSRDSDGIYDALELGPSIPELQRYGYLSELGYYAPPIDGLDDISRRGTEFDAGELDDLLKRNHVYGAVIDHYRQYGRAPELPSYSTADAPTTRAPRIFRNGKPALIFCRTVRSAYETADRFREAGFEFHCLEGNLGAKKRRQLVQALRDGRIDGLTNCEICTYGLDVPRIEYAASLRPTMSRALYMQMVGRVLRPFEIRGEDGRIVYRKQESLFFDHVNLVRTHQDKANPGVPLFYLDQIDWAFDGRRKIPREVEYAPIPKLCPYIGYRYCMKQNCKECRHQSELDATEKLEEIDGALQRLEQPAEMKQRPFDQQRWYRERIAECKARHASGKDIDPGIIGEMLQMARSLSRSPLWVYHELTEGERAVNVTLLHEIARQMGYKPGWVRFQKSRLAAESGGRR